MRLLTINRWNSRNFKHFSYK